MRHWKTASSHQTLFENPFYIEDLRVLDAGMLQHILSHAQFGITLEEWACAVHDASYIVIDHLRQCMAPKQREYFTRLLQLPYDSEQSKRIRKQILDQLFWELTYWKTPELYEALTEGEHLHAGIFQSLEPDIHAHIVLDAGAGSGRATIECLRAGAGRVYAVEPSPGLLRILRRKLLAQEGGERVIVAQGRFEALPLEDQSVDVALSCSAFTAEAEQGGEEGLRELRRVTRRGGKIVIIWPRSEDRAWLEAHGFRYVFLPIVQEMKVTFPSLQDALFCARRFYAHNPAVTHHLLATQCPEVPFSVIGLEPPHYYCWLQV